MIPIHSRNTPIHAPNRPARRLLRGRLHASWGEVRGVNTTITKTATVVAVKDHVSCTLDEEAVVLHLKKGMYYGLNSVGATVWNALQQPRKVAEIQQLILAEYDVDPGPCEQDLLHLLQELAEVGLIEVQDG